MLSLGLNFVGARSENEKAGCISLVSRYLR
jgi:hypothetical protein